MNRDFKFRVWDKCEKTMHEIYQFQNIIMSPCWSRVMRFASSQRELEDVDDNGEDDDRTLNDIIIMQYTGLKDSKRTEKYPEGQEIYEGDIIKLDSLYVTSAVVEFGSHSAQGSDYYANTAYGYYFEELDGEQNQLDENEIEVIGNIYENPELLNKEVTNG